MKTLLSIFLILSFSTYSQNCYWANYAGGGESDAGRGVAADHAGHVYSTGTYYSSKIVFGSDTLHNTGSFSSDFFVVKYDAAGNIIWSKSFGSNLEDESRGIVCDLTGNIYVTGYFRGDSITFGSTTFHNQIVGYSDVFILKLDPNGNVIWAKQAGNNESDETPNAIAFSNGRIGITGRFHSRAMHFDAVAILNSDTSGSTTDIFTAVYQSNGSISWAAAAGGLGTDNAYSLILSGDSVFITGTFNSDTLHFGSYPLPNISNGNYQAFFAKYNSGFFEWAHATKGADMATGYGIAIDGSSLYITGSFRSTAIFDTDTLHSNGSWYDLFLAKYDRYYGNLIDVKGYGGYGEDDFSYAIDLDSASNVYITGSFQSDSVNFDGQIIYNSHPGNNPQNFFTARFDPSLICHSALSTGGNNTGRAITVNDFDDVYINGNFTGSMYINDDTLLNSGQDDYFILHPYSFSHSAAATNNNCNGAADGTIAITTNGGANPLNYLWSTGATTASLSNLSAGMYSIAITDSNGCILNDTIIITEPVMDSVSICMVTVDSLSQHNIIMWDKTPFADADSFIVFRETTTNNYQPIAAIPFDSLSAFIDTVSQLYFPNTGDPNAGTYRYKIQARDTCGGLTAMSPYHNTIFMTNNSGVFSWAQLYTIEGSPNPVNSYVLMRDDSSNGNWHSIASVTGTQQTVSDPQYALYQNTASWRIQTQWNIQCNPTRSAYSSSYSNLYNTFMVGINQIDGPEISLYPNPALNELFITSDSPIEYLVLFDLNGKLVFEQAETNSMKAKINLDNISEGVYFIRVQTKAGLRYRRVMKEL